MKDERVEITRLYVDLYTWVNTYIDHRSKISIKTTNHELIIVPQRLPPQRVRLVKQIIWIILSLEIAEPVEIATEYVTGTVVCSPVERFFSHSIATAQNSSATARSMRRHSCHNAKRYHLHGRNFNITATSENSKRRELRRRRSKNRCWLDTARSGCLDTRSIQSTGYSRKGIPEILSHVR